MPLPTIRLMLVAVCLSGASLFAQAQSPLDRYDAPGRAGPPVHVSEFGRYTLQANAVSTEALAHSTAREHGIERAADRGVLNLVILESRDGQQVPVQADVSATQHNLLNQTEAIEMREVQQNGRVSYLGEFGFSPLRNFSFTITARPVGGGEPMTIRFEDRLVTRQ